MKYLPFLLLLLVTACASGKDSAPNHYDVNTEVQAINRGVALQQFRDGVAFLNDHKYDDALSSFQTCLRMEPHNAAALGASGVAYAAKGDTTNAINFFDQALQLRPDPVTYLNRGNLYRSEGRFNEAISDFNACLRLDQTNTTAYLCRASAYSYLRKYEKGIADINKALTLIPATDASTTVAALVMRADAWGNSQKYDNARMDFEKAFSVLPSDLGLHNDYAWFLATCPDAAYRNGSKAVTLATLACNQTGWSQWQYVDTLAVAYAAEKDFAKAIDCEQRVLQVPNLDPQSRKDIQTRLNLFLNHQPYLQPPPGK